MPSEEAAFNVGGRERCCRFVGVHGLVVALEASEQVGAGGVEPVIAGEVEAMIRARAAAGPASSPTAMARFRKTTGVGVKVRSWS